MQCYTKEKLDNRFEHWSKYAWDAFCRQCWSTDTLKISCKKLFNSTISINGREISNLRFADDFDLIAGTDYFDLIAGT